MWSVIVLSACSTPDPTPATPPAAPPPVENGQQPEEQRATPPPAAANNPPTITRVSFTNNAPTAAENVNAVVTTADQENDPIDLDFEWFVNDERVLGVSSERLSGRFKKGDKIRAVVTADDGQNEVHKDSPVITIANIAPEILTDPRKVNKADGFVFKATDEDEDDLKWRLEGAPSGMTISPAGKLAYTGSANEPGGAYTVGVIVEDGDAWGRIDFAITVSPGSKAAK